MIFTERTNIFPALIKARGSVSEIVKDTKGNFGKYATLSGINDAIMPALVANGLTVAQEVSTDYRDTTLMVTVETWLCHTSGEYIQFAPLALPVDKPTAQGVGSAITYGRRYALMAALNLSADDDDGQAASAPATVQRTAPAQKTQPAAPQGPQTGNGNAAPEPAHEEQFFGMEAGDTLADTHTLVNMHELGGALYGKQWDRIRHDNIRKLTNGRTESSKEITESECRRLNAGMAKLLAAKEKIKAQPEAA